MHVHVCLSKAGKQGGPTLVVHFLQVLYEFVFSRSDIDSAFGIYCTFPRSLVDVTGTQTIADVQNTFAVEVDDNLNDPLIALEFSVSNNVQY